MLPNKQGGETSGAPSHLSRTTATSQTCVEDPLGPTVSMVIKKKTLPSHLERKDDGRDGISLLAEGQDCCVASGVRGGEVGPPNEETKVTLALIIAGRQHHVGRAGMPAGAICEMETQCGRESRGPKSGWKCSQ